LVVGFQIKKSYKVKETGVIFPATPPAPTSLPTPGSGSICIETEQELKRAVKSCNQRVNESSCLIDICSIHLSIHGASTSSGMNETKYQGIDTSNKNIMLRCEASCPGKRCILDGLSTTRLFYGSFTNITFLNFIFTNGYHPTDGGAMKFDNNSMVTMINCSFANNTAPSGSAVYINNSNIFVLGKETSIVNNTGMIPPFAIFSSQMNISQASFAGNKVSEYRAAILLLDSNISYYDIQVYKSLMMLENGNDLTMDDCDVYVAIDVNNFANKSSCLTFDESNASIPFIDLSKTCPTPSSTPVPTPQPTSRPSPSCFSGENIVEVKDVGPVPMHTIRIGDQVKSSLDGTYTQVFGFGHYDHQLERPFRRFLMEYNILNSSSNETIPISSNQPQQQNQQSFLEISDHHFVMIEIYHQQYRIAAAEVRVNDILSGQRVVSIEHDVIRRGVYAPLTQTGEMIVGGILVSNYVHLRNVPRTILAWDQHTWAHMLFYPQRIFCHYYMEVCTNERYVKGYGLVAYVIIAGSSFLSTNLEIIGEFPVVIMYCILLLLLLLFLIFIRS
jgi:Hint module